MRTKTDANNDETLREPLLEVQPGTQNNLVPLPFFVEPWSLDNGVWKDVRCLTLGEIADGLGYGISSYSRISA